MIELFVVTVLVLVAGYGYARMRRADEAARRYLESAGEKPLQLAHLSEVLQRVTRETRTLRISLESPVQALREHMRRDLSQVTGARAIIDVDLTRTEDDHEALDALLLDASRDVGLWLQMVDSLQPHERQELEALGASPETVRGVMAAENGAFERERIKAAGRPPLDQRMEALMRELLRIEQALQGQGHVYR
jgi:hypothetical protein